MKSILDVLPKAQIEEIGTSLYVTNPNFYGEFDLNLGKVKLPESNFYLLTLNQIKRQYSINVVKSQAKKHKWVLKQKSDVSFQARRY